MKTITRNLMILLFLFTQSTNLFSQNSTDFTTIIPGKIYKIVLTDDNQFIGKAISVDSSNVIILTEEKITMGIPQNMIRYFTNDVSSSKYKFLVSLTGGADLFTENPSTDYSQTKLGQDYQLSGFYFLSNSRAFKIDLRFSYINPKYPNIYPNPINPYPTIYSGGNTSIFVLKGNFLIGSFNPKNKLIAYVSAGIGLHYVAQSEFQEMDPYFPSNNQVITTPARNELNAVFSIGASLGYRFSKNFGASGEIEYNLVTKNYESLLYGGRSNFPVRIGIFYVL